MSSRNVHPLVGDIQHLMGEVALLRAALKPFVDAYKKGAHPIPDSDLYDEQPRSVSVTLGDCRRAARVMP